MVWLEEFRTYLRALVLPIHTDYLALLYTATLLLVLASVILTVVTWCNEKSLKRTCQLFMGMGFICMSSALFIHVLVWHAGATLAPIEVASESSYKIFDVTYPDGTITQFYRIEDAPIPYDVNVTRHFGKYAPKGSHVLCRKYRRDYHGIYFDKPPNSSDFDKFADRYVLVSSQLK